MFDVVLKEASPAGSDITDSASFSDEYVYVSVAPACGAQRL